MGLFLSKTIVMDTLSYKTKSINKANANKEWVIVDATDQSLGRFAAMVAFMLRGKHKPSFTPNSDCGDNVIVINAEKVKLTGNKMTDKEYVRYTGYPGGQRFTSPAELLKRKPEAVVEMAIKGMLPKTKLGAELFRNLYVYAGTEHKHEGQQPKSVNINEIK
ncbi:50S ribosomal protein L13 [bioreactor metagenome]|uniref:50S ribosomal protein L13 n=1 Tax=bioreactor metagenome TaxID=1076179 RepID=A0A644X178_9ZZZZ